MLGEVNTLIPKIIFCLHTNQDFNSVDNINEPLNKKDANYSKELEKFLILLQYISISK